MKLIIAIATAATVAVLISATGSARGTQNCVSTLTFQSAPVYNVVAHALQTNDYQSVSTMQVDMYIDNWWAKPFCVPKY